MATVSTRMFGCVRSKPSTRRAMGLLSVNVLVYHVIVWTSTRFEGGAGLQAQTQSRASTQSRSSTRGTIPGRIFRRMYIPPDNAHGAVMSATTSCLADVAAEFSWDRLRPSRQHRGGMVPAYPVDDVVGFGVLGRVPQGAAVASFV